MIGVAPSLLRFRLQTFIPALSLLVAACIDLLPLPSAAPDACAPSISLIVLFFWSAERPDLMSPQIVLACGVTIDLLAGLPPGLTSLSFLVLRSVVVRDRAMRRRLAGLSGWVEFLAVAAVVFTVRWAIASAWWLEPLPLGLQPVEFLLTVAAYPPVSWLLRQLRSSSGVLRHAPGF
jgi:rod shape-determining protein MreD